jgi:hypothetical protein
MIRWDEVAAVRRGELLRSRESDGQQDDPEDVVYRGRRWKRVLVDDLGIDEPIIGPGHEDEELADRSSHQMVPINHYLEERVRRILSRLSTAEELAAHCIIWSMTGSWDDSVWRAQERLFEQWQMAGVLLRAPDISLERQIYLIERLRSLASHGVLTVQEWDERHVAAVWDHAIGQEEAAAQWGRTWAAAGIDCPLIGAAHPFWKLLCSDSPQADALVTGLSRIGVALGKVEPPARLIVGVGLGVHSCDWMKVASREIVRWTPPKLKPLRLIDCSKVNPSVLPQLLLLGEFDGLIVHQEVDQMIGLLVQSLRERIVTEEQLIERAYRLILLREWLALCRCP